MYPASVSAQSGFSLVETMVTVAIVGLMAAAVSMTLLGRPDPITLEAERLYARFEAAHESALVNGEVIGFAPDAGGTGYRFLNFRDGVWQDLPDHPALAPYDLPEGLHIFPAGAGPDESGTPAPLLWFDPTGFDQPFTLLLQGPARDIRIVRDGRAELSIETGRAGR